MEILSIIASVVSIVLGIYAIVQAERYNKESEKFNIDTRKMLSLQLEEIQMIEKKIVRDLIKTEENVICLAKDSGLIYKLNTYDKCNSSIVFDVFKKLKVKTSVLKRFEKFLEEDDEKFFFDFFCMAETRDEREIRSVKELLEKWGLVLIVNYQARKH